MGVYTRTHIHGSISPRAATGAASYSEFILKIIPCETRESIKESYEVSNFEKNEFEWRILTKVYMDDSVTYIRALCFPQLLNATFLKYSTTKFVV